MSASAISSDMFLSPTIVILRDWSAAKCLGVAFSRGRMRCARPGADRLWSALGDREDSPLSSKEKRPFMSFCMGNAAIVLASFGPSF